MLTTPTPRVTAVHMAKTIIMMKMGDIMLYLFPYQEG
jgi:hypothetical protein